jgi:hypothetical protein
MILTKVAAFALLGSIAATYVPVTRDDKGHVDKGDDRKDPGHRKVQIHPDHNRNKCVTVKFCDKDKDNRKDDRHRDDKDKDDRKDDRHRDGSDGGNRKDKDDRKDDRHRDDKDNRHHDDDDKDFEIVM